MDRTDKRIAEMVLAGEANKTIAAQLGLPEGTVKWRRTACTSD